MAKPKWGVRATATGESGAGDGGDAHGGHTRVGRGLGKIGVVGARESSGEPETLNAFGRQVAMHIAAANPQAVDTKSLEPGLIERERAVLTEQAKESGKPDAVIEKMVGNIGPGTVFRTSEPTITRGVDGNFVECLCEFRFPGQDIIGGSTLIQCLARAVD